MYIVSYFKSKEEGSISFVSFPERWRVVRISKVYAESNLLVNGIVSRVVYSIFNGLLV